MKKIGIICALEREAQQIQNRLSVHTTQTVGPFSFVHGTLNGREIILSQSGIGKVNAALNTAALITSFTPDAVINSGVAGGLVATQNPLESVIGTQYVYHDVWCGDGNEYGQVQGLPTFFDADPQLLAAARTCANAADHPVHLGLICTGDQFISGPAALPILKHFPHALACDMESAAIAQVCYRYHTPFISVRLLSDIAGKDTANFTQYENFWAQLAQQGFANTWALLTALTAEKTHV